MTSSWHWGKSFVLLYTVVRLRLTRDTWMSRNDIRNIRRDFYYFTPAWTREICDLFYEVRNLGHVVRNEQNDSQVQCVLKLDQERDLLIAFMNILWSSRCVAICCRYNDQHMMMSSNGNIFRVTGHLCGEFTGPEFPTQRPVTRALMFSLICARINFWVNNREAGDLRRHRAQFDVIVMSLIVFIPIVNIVG